MKNHTDVLPARLIIGSLAVIGFTLCVGILVLLYMDKKVDAALYTIAGSCISAIGALLSNPNSRPAPSRSDDEPVPVTTPPNTPLEVTRVDTPPDDPTPDSEPPSEPLNEESKPL